MADETPDTTRQPAPREGAREPGSEPAREAGREGGREKRESTREGAGARRAMSDASATEKPAKTTPAARTTRYVVTVDNVTGLILKVEKLNETAAKEAAAMTTPVDPASLATTFSAPPPDPAAVVQAYYRGIADYLNALMTVK